jgi:hypothetical protein
MNQELATMPSDNIIHIAVELSLSSWLVAARLPGTEKSRLHRIEGGDATALENSADTLAALGKIVVAGLRVVSGHRDDPG